MLQIRWLSLRNMLLLKEAELLFSAALIPKLSPIPSASLKSFPNIH